MISVSARSAKINYKNLKEVLEHIYTMGSYVTLFAPTRALPPVPVDSSWPRTTWLLLNTAQRQGALLWMGHGHPRFPGRGGPQAHTCHFVHTGCPHPVGCGKRTQGQNRRNPKCGCWNHTRGKGCIFSHFGTLWVRHAHF